MTRAAIAAALLSALLLWASSPAVGAGWLAWIALVPVAAVALRWPGERAGRLAVPLAYAVYLELLLIPALPFGLTEGQWGDPPPILVASSPVLFVALVAIPLFGLLLYLLRFGQPWGVGQAPAWLAPALAVLVPALGWTALDLLRAKLDPGGLWGPLFLSQADADAADLAALGGPWLLTLVIVAFNYALALAVVSAPRVPALTAAGAVGAAALVAPAVWGPDGGDGPALRVAAIQPGYDTAELERPELRYWDEGTYDLAALDLIRDLGGLSREAAQGGAELIVWPEASMFVDPRDYPRVSAALRRLAREIEAVIVVPYFNEPTNRGAAIAAVPPGRASRTRRGPGPVFTEPQPKQQPMWFLGEKGSNPPDPQPVEAGGVMIGTMLGVDTQDPSVARELSDQGAELISSSTHDWEQVAPQHRAFAALAARASGVPVVRADWHYGSAIFGRDGSPIADAGEEKSRTVLSAEVAPGEPTPYARIGDVVGWVAVALSVLTWVGAHALRVARRRRAGAAAKTAGAPAAG